MGLTPAEFRLLTEAREELRTVREELRKLAIAFAEHCAAEKATGRELAARRSSRAPWVAAGAAWAAVALAVVALLSR